jgi:hypothetical protein
MKRENEEKDTSDREADLYERKFHRDLALKLSGTGMACMALGTYLRASVVWLLILSGLSIVFFAKAWGHHRKAQAVEERIRQAGVLDN